ncbi:Mesenchymal stem cell protein DSCD75 [Stenotrophomonas sp. Betaine-02u-21]|uniref:acyl-CoA thioesterase n=1 Tax=unclassified Stenotrophomonas TaxID=196198 RepID=UPI000C34D730|nr:MULTISPECIES: thioesterase family protein [unclassified Stenotrophomonas]PKH70230.1 Mesenchymal stem cell protein DSCD75 [Stenotrophomonas sp. Betaine-02u-23]PKH73781.1 Mesenchymal stem cell protein DSCD75 [Stenotrophomonas sp. Betaine-02u-21]PKH97654.1 Mesenchymal stem cell protein DSCD75 [Stenotrophomonas sp. Bg11-02]
MNLWFRLLLLLLRTPFQPRLAAPGGVSRLRFRVWFNDLDTNGHVNNGRYWTLFDLGRTDLIVRMGLLKAVIKNRWMPIVGGGAIRFRRELKLFQPFTLETRLLAWTDSRVIFEQRILTGADEVVATRGLVLAGLYDRNARRYVPLDVIFESVGVKDASSPALDGAAQALLDLDASLKLDPGP